MKDSGLFIFFTFVVICLFYFLGTDYYPTNNGVLIKRPFGSFLAYKKFSKKKFPGINWRYLLRYSYLESKEDCAIVVIDRYFQEPYLVRNKICLMENETDPLGLGVKIDKNALEAEMKRRGMVPNANTSSKQNSNSQYPDGTIIENKQTGERRIMKNGQWQEIKSSQQSLSEKRKILKNNGYTDAQIDEYFKIKGLKDIEAMDKKSDKPKRIYNEKDPLGLNLAF